VTLRPGLVVPAAVATLMLATGCGGHASEKDGQHELGGAADTKTCVADAHAVTSYPAGFPKGFVFPDKTVVFHAEDRGPDGVVVTGVTSLPFKQVLASLNGPTQRAGYKVTRGETEEHDAEANWSGHGYRGRWAIRTSGSCPGETVVQVLSTKS
jgi:hypothetical protein